MNFKLALSGLLSAALLTGCGSAPKLSEPSGDWEDMPFTHAPTPRQAVIAAPVAPPPTAELEQLVASAAPEAPPLTVRRPARRKPRPVAASPVPEAPAVTPPSDSKCSAN
ncbi:conjugal transfer protein [Pseudomonas sp. Marseille-Q5115]|uniref:conjugal transfer protein n=1 Tax=Pseudomonas sp. Marseille-Q5115 TaxID=2866593 RepID=UPI001CE3E0D9|nr:conjugal transfer protein [Pseudomonas sp. Marseille-Q5115]